jgi:hypothetical protein
LLLFVSLILFVLNSDHIFLDQLLFYPKQVVYYDFENCSVLKTERRS